MDEREGQGKKMKEGTKEKGEREKMKEGKKEEENSERKGERGHIFVARFVLLLFGAIC